MKIPLTDAQLSRLNTIRPDIALVDNTIDSEGYIYVKTKFGICKNHYGHIVNKKVIPSITTALDKNSFFKNQLLDKYPDFEKNYTIIGNYEKGNIKILIKTLYGNCLVSPNGLLSGNCPNILSAVDKNSFFKNQIAEKCSGFFDKYTLISDYVKSSDLVYFESAEGIFCIKPSNLLHRGQLNNSCKSVPDKTEYFINQAKKVHGDLYRYTSSVYKNSITKIDIICKEHGIFSQLPFSHIKGAGCKLCANKRNGENIKLSLVDFIEKSIKKHKGVYSYDKVDYINYNEKVIITCSEHGDFEQTPLAHLSQNGCVKCSNEKMSIVNNSWNYSKWETCGNNSKVFDSFKLYIIKCWNNDEVFYKIGKTFKTIQKRFNSTCTMPYNYEVLTIIEGEAKVISTLEDRLKNINKNFKYLPFIDFGGRYECFKDLTDALRI